MNIDARKAVEALEENIKKRFTKQEVNTSMARAMNRSIAKAKTLLSRQIRENYKIKMADLNGKLILGKASANRPQAELKGSTRTLTIGRFVTNVESWRAGSNTNLEAEILKGDSKMLPRGLFVNPKNGLIMGKGEYSSGRFVKNKYGKLQAIKTVSPYGAAINEGIQDAIGPDIEEYYGNRLLHELRYLALKVGAPNDF